MSSISTPFVSAGRMEVSFKGVYTMLSLLCILKHAMTSFSSEDEIKHEKLTRENKPKDYAGLYSQSEYDNCSVEEMPFFPCDYILKLRGGSLSGKELRLRDLGNKVLIGSNKHCNFIINDQNISPRHCVVEYEEGSFYYKIKDLNSRTGTWQKLSPLSPGLSLSITTSFIFFHHSFTIEFPQNITKKSMDSSAPIAVLIVTDGPNRGKKIPLHKNGCILIGKSTHSLSFDPHIPEDEQVVIKEANGNICVFEESLEEHDGGIYFRMIGGGERGIKGGDGRKWRL